MVRALGMVGIFTIAFILATQVSAQTTETAPLADEVTTLSLSSLVQETTPTEPTSADDAELVKILILGEKVGLNIDTPKKGPFPDYVALTTATLGGRVTDMTTVGLTMADILEQAKSDVAETPDLVIVFTGFSDEQDDTKEDNQRKALGQIAMEFIRRNQNSQVVFIPASTNVGAMTIANMRLAADGTNVHYIPIGTEVGGRPYLDALESVKEELLAASQADPEPSVTTTATPSNTVTVRGSEVESAPADEDDAPAMLSYEERKANLQAELDQVAGQAGEAIMTLPSLTDAMTTGFIDASSTGTAGVVTKRGTEAVDQSIKMKSLPAVKAFRPQVPVPRNEVQVKEPALSR